MRILDAWAEQRKEARVLLVLDISGSMGEPATDDETKLDLAKQAAVTALDQFKDADEVGLWVFSTDLGGDDPNYREAVPVAPIGENRDQLEEQILAQFPTNGTPLYDVTSKSYAAMLETYDPEKINAIVLLTDGVNDDGNLGDDDDQFDALIAQLQSGSEGASLATGARVHDLLRRRRRRGDAAGHRPGDVGRPLRRIEPRHHRTGLHGRHLQLLASVSQLRFLPWPDPASAIASSRRRSPAPSCRRSESSCSVPRRPGRS